MEGAGYGVIKPTIIVLTGFADIFDQFQESIGVHEPHANVVVVTSRGVDLLVRNKKWKVIAGIEPFIFARNANVGIREAGRSDVLLMNDDARFVGARTVETITRAAYSDEKIGILSPQIIGGAGSYIQSKKDDSRRLEYTMDRLAFACVYIKRAVIDSIGLLDERFDGYGGEDDDYCIRAVKAGFRLAVTSDVWVRHGFQHSHTSSSSFRRVMANKESSASEMRAKYESKHGCLIGDPWR
jgi:hypothetical protein